MGNAIPSASTTDTANPVGEIAKLPENIGTPTGEVISIDDVIAVPGNAGMAFGTAKQFQDGDTTVVTTEDSSDDACGTTTASVENKQFVQACGDTVYLYPAVDPTKVEKRPLPDSVAHATSAVLLSTGELIVGSNSQNTLTVISGDEVDTLDMASPADQLVSVSVPDDDDAVVRATRHDTTVQDAQWRDKQQGGTLRVGRGVGLIAPGEKGLILASDTLGGQLAIYMADDVIRLQQTIPVEDSPWGVAWDSKDALAWVTSTSKNTAAAYDISQGEPKLQANIPIVSGARGMTSLSDATLVVVSSDERSLNIITNPLGQTSVPNSKDEELSGGVSGS